MSEPPQSTWFNLHKCGTCNSQASSGNLYWSTEKSSQNSCSGIAWSRKNMMRKVSVISWNVNYMSFNKMVSHSSWVSGSERQLESTGSRKLTLLIRAKQEFRASRMFSASHMQMDQQLWRRCQKTPTANSWESPNWGTHSASKGRAAEGLSQMLYLKKKYIFIIL